MTIMRGLSLLACGAAISALALTAAPEIRGIMDRSRATIVLGVDGSVSGNASCNAYSGRSPPGVSSTGWLLCAVPRSRGP